MASASINMKHLGFPQHGLPVRFGMMQLRMMISVVRENGKMISEGMAKAVKDFYADYQGCRNCRFQPEPLRMCKWGERRKYVEIICSRWRRRDDNK